MPETSDRPRALEPAGAPAFAIALRFAAVYVAAELSLRTAAAAGWFTWLQNATAVVAGAIMGALGIDAVVEGCVITSGASTVNVSGYCVPSSALALTIALILVSIPAPLWRRAVWAALGAIVVLAVNVVRVAIVGWMAAGASQWLDPVHVNVLPVILALSGLVVWWLALRWERTHD